MESTATRRIGITFAILAVAVAAAFALCFASPQQAEAKTISDTASYSFDSSASVSTSSSALKVTGTLYRIKGSSFKTLSYNTYKFKLTSSTKYYNVTNTQTGAKQAIGKKAAFSKLKSKSFIAAHLDVKNGKVQQLYFGA